MPQVVKVSTLETQQDLMAAIEGHFKAGRYAEITQAIGMHSIIIDSEHTMQDQSRLYHAVLNMIKDKIKAGLGKQYSSWYVNFPQLLDKMESAGTDKDKIVAGVLASRHEAFGPFKSLDDFFFWSLDDRRLSLDQIVTYIEKTAAMAQQ